MKTKLMRVNKEEDLVKHLWRNFFENKLLILENVPYSALPARYGTCCKIKSNLVIFEKIPS